MATFEIKVRVTEDLMDEADTEVVELSAKWALTHGCADYGYFQSAEVLSVEAVDE